MLYVVSVFKVRTGFVTDSEYNSCLISLCTTWVANVCYRRGNTLSADRMSSGQDNRAALHHPASPWTQRHMVDSSWWKEEGRPLIFPSDKEEKRKRFSLFSVNYLKLTYLVSRLPTYFGNLQNMLPPKRLVFYLWHVQANVLPKLLATLSTSNSLLRETQTH